MRKNTIKAARHAKALRTTMPDAEVILWSFLKKGRQGGLRFRRQHPLGPYITDFACIAARLVIEVDGPTHWTDEGRSHDRRRTAYLEANGWRVVRICNEDIYRNLDAVLEHIAICTAPLRLQHRVPRRAATSPAKAVEETGE